MHDPEEPTPWRWPQVWLGLAILLLLGGVSGGAYWWFFLRSQAGAARYVPAETLFFATLPHPPATWLRYEQSNLKKVLGGDEAKTVGALCAGLVQQQLNAGAAKEKLKIWSEIAELLGSTLNGEALVAVSATAGSPQIPVSLLAAVSPTLNAGNFDVFIAKMKTELLALEPKLKTGTGQRGTVTYEWAELQPEQPRVCYAKVKGWYVTTWGEAALWDFVDRVTGQITTDTSLEKNPDYQLLRKQLAMPEADGLVYVSVPLLMGVAQKAVAKLPGTVGSQMGVFAEAYRDFRGAMTGAQFVGADIMDRTVMLWPTAQRPKMGPLYEPCAYQTLSFTCKDTLLYTGQNFSFRDYYDSLLRIYEKSTPSMAQMMRGWEANLGGTGLDLKKNILDPLGPEFSLQVEWPEGRPYPEPGLMVEIKNRPDFEPTAQWLIKTIKIMAAGWGGAVQGGVDNNVLLTVKVPQVPLWSPTLLVGDKFVGLFATETAAKRVAVPLAPVETLPYTEGFKSVAGSRQAGSYALIFCNTPRLLQQSYGTLKPFVPMLLEQIAKGSNPLKNILLPETLSLAPHCGAWLCVQRSASDFLEMESISGIGNQLYPAAGLIGAIAGVSSAGRAAKQKEIQAAAVQREGEANPENIRADLQELRVVIESWAQTEAVPVGTEVTWEKIKGTMISDSRLAQSNGLDRLGHPYVLGRVGGPRAEVAAETKQAFVGKVATGFWEQASAPPGPSATPAPASPTPAGSSQPL